MMGGSCGLWAGVEIPVVLLITYSLVLTDCCSFSLSFFGNLILAIILFLMNLEAAIKSLNNAVRLQEEETGRTRIFIDSQCSLIASEVIFFKSFRFTC